MNFKDNISKRITNIRKRYLKSVSYISIQRALLFTKKWQETEGTDISINERVAECMKCVFAHMSHYIDPDDCLAGNWTEYFLGIPVDIERGLFNDIFNIELKKRTLFTSQVISTVRFLIYFVKNNGIVRFIHNIYKSILAGVVTPGLGMRTMDKRKVNPYKINKKDKRILLKQLLPYWKERSVCAAIVKELETEDVFAGNVKPFLDSMPTSSSCGIIMLSPNAAIGTWQGHIVLDNTTVLQKGIIKMKDEVLYELKKPRLKKVERDFLRSLVIAYEGILIYVEKLGEELRKKWNQEENPKKKHNYKKMLEAVKKVPAYPAESFFEAVQAFWIIKTVVGLSVPFNAHGLGRLDQIFYPYYKRDREEGKITREDARELIEELLIKSMSHNIRPYSNYISDFAHRFDGSEAVTIGGITKNGTDATNDLTYLILEAAYRSKTVINVVVRVHKQTPEQLYLLISDVLYNKISNVSILNDDVCITALVNYGYTREDAREYAAISCADICTPGKSGAQGASSILLCNLLDTTLRNGDCATLVGEVSGVGPRTGEPESFMTFEAFRRAFIKQIVYTFTLLEKGVNIRDRVYAGQLPAPFISAFTPCTLIKKQDVTAGGEEYNVEFIILMNSIANLVDSLHVIKQLVFEERIITLRELCSAIDDNYHGYDELHNRIINLRDKWGNGNPTTDQFARDIVNCFVEEIKKYRNFRNGRFVPSIVSMITHTISGRLGIATPDGRKAARPYAAGCGPYNVEKNGPTGVFRSVASLDFTHILECSLNMKLHPSFIGKNIESRKKWVSLLRTYCNTGGMQLQPTVVAKRDLLEAQIDPDAYRDLIVKVGGYSVYFTELGKELQAEIISRTEHSRML